MINAMHFCSLFVVLTLSSTALCGNYRAFFMADEAAMTGGAGIAVSRDSGSLWYNPAGLGGLKLGRMELTGTVYSLKLRPMRGMLETDLPSGKYTKDSTPKDFQPIPTSVVFVRNASDKLSYGLAIYQSNNSNVDYRLSLKTPYDKTSDALWSEGLEYHQQAALYHVGPALGYQINPRLRIGCSLYLEFVSTQVSLRGFAGIQEDDSQHNVNMLTSVSEQGSIMRLGATMTTGIQWEFVPNWHAGLVFKTPTFQFFLSNSLSSLESEAEVADGSGAMTFEYMETDESHLGFSQIKPLEVQLGLVYQKDGNWLGIEGAVRPPLDKKNMSALWNVSIGGRLKVSELFSWGAGVFTDRNPQKLSNSLLDWQSDRYGITTGVEFKTPLLVQEMATQKEDGETDSKETPTKKRQKKKHQKLVWATTVALSYAFELAEFNSLYVEAKDDLIIEPKRKTGIFHQPTVYLGTALYF